MEGFKTIWRRGKYGGKTLTGRQEKVKNHRIEVRQKRGKCRERLYLYRTKRIDYVIKNAKEYENEEKLKWK